MKVRCLSVVLLAFSLVSFFSFSQSEDEAPLLGLPGDDLDLYVVLDLFQKSKTIEDFEESLNNTSEGIVNLDLNNDGKVDFIKVVTEQDGDDFLFILQDLVSSKETQDVAVITVSKDSSGKVAMQIIGDKALYGADYVIEPVSEATASVTANPAYTGSDPVTVNVAASTEVIVVQSAPIVKYVYSPVYVPYYPSYYYGFYPPYWRAVAVVSIGVYRHNHWYHHGGYHGGYYGRPGYPSHHTTVNINNSRTYNNYSNNKRSTSATVNNNVRNGNFKTAGQEGSRPTTSQNKRVSNGASTNNRASTSNRAKTSTANKSTANRATTTSANRSTGAMTNHRATTSNRASTSNMSTNRSNSSSSFNRSSASRSMGSTPRSSSSSFGTGRASRGRVR